MRRLILATVLLLALPNIALAEEKPADRFMEEFEKFSEEAQDFFGGLAESIAPMLEGLNEKIGDLSQYEPPEVLPNGDIIIRRKAPLSPEDPASPAPEGQVDL